MIKLIAHTLIGKIQDVFYISTLEALTFAGTGLLTNFLGLTNKPKALEVLNYALADIYTRASGNIFLRPVEKADVSENAKITLQTALISVFASLITGKVFLENYGIKEFLNNIARTTITGALTLTVENKI